MVYEYLYRKDGKPSVKVVYPDQDAPMIPQSCYAFGAREHVDACRAINAAAEAIHDALSHAPDRDVDLDIAAAQLVDDLMCAMGYERTGTEQV